MTETSNIREERIERLLRELEYEVTRGMLEKDVAEELTFRFIVPRSSKIPDGVIVCEFRTRPMPCYSMIGNDYLASPRLRIVR